MVVVKGDDHDFLSNLAADAHDGLIGINVKENEMSGGSNRNRMLWSLTQ